MELRKQTMKKYTVLFLAAVCLICFPACGRSKTTELAVKLEALPIISDSENISKAQDASIAEFAAETYTSEMIRISPNFNSEQTRNMSNFSNGGFYYADDVLYGQLCPVSGDYLRMSAVELRHDGEYFHFGTPVFMDDDVSASCLCLDGETLYYVRELNSAGGLSICRVNKNGENFEILYEGQDCNYLQLHGGRLFFTNEDHNFVSTDMNGMDMQIIIDKEVYFPYFIDEEWVLYQDDADNESLHFFNTVSRYDIKLNDMRSYTPVIAGSELFYLGVPEGKTNHHLCHIDLSNLELEITDRITEYVLGREVEVGDQDVYTMFTDGEYIYGANNTVASITDWRSFTDEGYSYLSENCLFLHDGFSIGYQLNSSGAVKNIFLRKLTTTAASVLPRVYG